MLREITNVRQTSKKRVKRWFTSSNIDIFVWQDTAQNIDKFQCTYNKATIEKALIWTASVGFSHHSVDSGERPGKYPESPIFTTDIDFNPIALCALLDQEIDRSASRVLCDVDEIIEQQFKK